MSRLLLIGLLVTMAIACVTAKCDIGFFCDNIKGRRETLPGNQENYLDEGMRMSKPMPFKMKLARRRAMARFLANGYRFLEKENDH
jgi:hypothetical protein